METANQLSADAQKRVVSASRFLRCSSDGLRRHRKQEKKVFSQDLLRGWHQASTIPCNRDTIESNFCLVSPVSRSGSETHGV